MRLFNRSVIVVAAFTALACSDPAPDGGNDEPAPDTTDVGETAVDDAVTIDEDAAASADVPDVGRLSDVGGELPVEPDTDAIPPDEGGPEDAPAPVDAGPEDVGPEEDTAPPLYCEPETQRCLTDLIAQTCVVEGTHWVDQLCEEGERCWKGDCAPIVCEPEALGNNCASPFGWGVCNPVGTGYEPVDCEPGQTCYLGACVDWKCEPGMKTCWGMTWVQQCKDDGSDWELIQACEAGGMCTPLTLEGGVQSAQCLTGCEVSDLARRNVGCEFVALAPNILGDLEATAVRMTPPPAGLDTEITIKNILTGEPLGEPFVIEAGLSGTVLLPPGSEVEGSGVSELAWRITTSAPVQAQIITPGFGEPHDVSLLLPVRPEATEFVVPSWPVQKNGVGAATGTITVVATSPGTTKLIFVPRADVAPGPQGSVVIDVLAHQTVPYVLEEGFVLQIEPKEILGADMSGSYLSSDKPIVMFAGHECARIPGELPECHHLQEQVPPVAHWGKRVVATPFAKRTDTQFDVFRIMAGAEAVSIVTSPPQPGYESFELQRGGFVTLHATAPFVVDANGPIMVQQFISGGVYPGAGTECNGKGVGEPAMALLVPTSQYVRSAILNPIAGVTTTWVDVIAPPDTTVTLDGVPINLAKIPVGDTGWSVQQAQVPEGVHQLEATRRVGVVMYGYGCGAAFATPAAMRQTDNTLAPYAFVLPPPALPKTAPFEEFPTDADEDEILSDVDNCPADANPDQADLDGDGIGDVCDPDVDGDGAPANLDCAPNDATVSPFTPEICNGVDDDCDNEIDEEGAAGCSDYYVDQDGDGAGSAGFALCLCTAIPPYSIEFGGDCNDSDPFVTPWSLEKCDDIDNDCNGLADEGCDDDLDGFCDADLQTVGFPSLCVNGGGDCLDYSAAINPGTAEVPNNFLDDDCDGLTDDETLADKDPDCFGLPCTGTTLQVLLCATELCFGPDQVLSITMESPSGSATDGMFAAIEHFGNKANDLAPRQGPSYLMLSTGDVTSTTTHDKAVGATPFQDPFPIFPSQVHDSIELTFKLHAPEGATGFRLDYLFLSAAYEEDVGVAASDKFYLIVNGPQTTGGNDLVVNYGPCVDPDFYADQSIGGKDVCYIDVNSAFGEGCLSESITDISGTGFECAPGNDAAGGSSTGWLRTKAPVASGELFTLTLHLHDTKNANVDSNVLIDNFHWLSGQQTYETIKLP